MDYFSQRRKQLMEKMGNKGLAVIFSAPKSVRNADTHYKYRADSFFYYLTGIKEPDAALILAPDTEAPFRIFVRPKDSMAEMWEGKRLGVEGAKQFCQADLAYSYDKLNEQIKTLIKHAGTLYYSFGKYAEFDHQVLPLLHSFRPDPRKQEKLLEGVLSTDLLVRDLRKVKSNAEIELLRKNCKNSALAHCEAMKFAKPELYEYQVQAHLEQEFMHGGAQEVAYSSIVAAGNNATVLHYITNQDQMQDGDLLLIDAGGEMDLYSSDITRTFPVNGKFSAAQKAIYEIVLEAQKATIDITRPGIAFHDLHNKSVDVIVDGLMDLKLLKGDRAQIITDREYRKFFPHGTGHWLGLDVHDAGSYYDNSGGSLPITVGNVFTVEPGIYIPEDMQDAPEEFRGIGIRIEDDILVTESGFENLTADVPKEISDVEAMVASGC